MHHVFFNQQTCDLKKPSSHRQMRSFLKQTGRHTLLSTLTYCLVKDILMSDFLERCYESVYIGAVWV